MNISIIIPALNEEKFISACFKSVKEATKMKMLKPFALKSGDTIGVFTPSSPGYAHNSGLFENGIKNLENLKWEAQ